MTGRERGPGRTNPSLSQNDHRNEVCPEDTSEEDEVRAHLERKRGLPVPQLGHSRRGSPATSAAAAARARRGLKTKQHDVYRALMSRGPSTDEQIVEFIQEWAGLGVLSQQTDSGIRSRRAELVALGVVGNTGRKGITKAGGKSIIWEVIE